jgi:L-asparaginase
MRRRADGRYAPAPGALAEALAGLPELRDPALPKIELLEFDPLAGLLRHAPAGLAAHRGRVEERAGGVDGVVVLHGTDTMAYTASALSFMLAGLLDRPVVLTGSQIPLAEVRSDARENLLTSLLLATTPFLREVVVYMGGSVLRGNRCTKVSASGFDAFASPNLPPLAEVGVDVAVAPGAAAPVASRTAAVRCACVTSASSRCGSSPASPGRRCGRCCAIRCAAWCWRPTAAATRPHATPTSSTPWPRRRSAAW